MLATPALLTILTLIGQDARTPLEDPRLGAPYVDGSYGFSVRPPKDWRISRQRERDGKAVVLLRMIEQVAAGGTHEISLAQMNVARPMAIEALLKGQRENLALSVNKPKVEAEQSQPIAGRPGGLLAATYESEGTEMLLIQAFVELLPTRYYVLAYRGPAAARKDAEPLFHLVLGSFALLEDKIDVEQTRAAVEAAARWLADLSGGDVRKALAAQRVMQYERDGKVIGFIRITEREDRDEHGRPGFVVRERGWTFGEDGSARRIQLNMFLSRDFKHETWKSRVVTWVPAAAAGGRAAWFDVALEDGVRTADVLISSQTYDLSRPLTNNPAMQLPPSYISRPLIRMVPRLLKDLARPRTLVLATYDHSRAGLALRTVELKGRAEPPEKVSAQTIFRMDEREGLAGDAAELYVDGSGRLLLVRAGPIVMRPADRRELERLFASRIAAAERAMADYEQGYRANEARFRRPPAP